jgi:hypothetical protein
VTQYWFRPKRYGYGATPVTWQGWVATLASALVIATINVSLVLTVRHDWPLDWMLAALLGLDVLAVVFLIMVTRRKTEGEWRWRWGDAD